MMKRYDGGRRRKGCARLKSIRTIIGKRKPNDRYDVRSRDFHAKDAHGSYGKLSNGTSGGVIHEITSRPSLVTPSGR